MSQLATSFLSLQPDYQNVIRLAQDRHGIHIVPLQELAGGWSGAKVYLVSVAIQDSNRVEHFVLKLDKQKPKSKLDEISRHDRVLSNSPEDFARRHIAEIAFDRIELDGAIAIFYFIAGQSLLTYRPMSQYERQGQLGEIFRTTYQLLLSGWNAELSTEQSIHPQQLLERWLGFRLKPDGNIEQFLKSGLRIRPEVPGWVVQNQIFLNPLLYARYRESWGTVRLVDTITGFIHGDLNTNNVLIKFSPDPTRLDGYYLIDFAMFKEGLPLLYDQRYLELSYLILKLSQIPFSRLADLLVQMGENENIDPGSVSVELVGVSQVINAARDAFRDWVSAHHPSLTDDLWGQYWLAGVAAGLGYAHKKHMMDQARLISLIYAATNLKYYATIFDIPRPDRYEQLYDQSRAAPRHAARATTSGGPERRHGLPAQTTKFIGRETQITDLENLLSIAEVRLITLWGTGGTGKSRLAIQIAAERRDQFPDGAIFVSLAETRQPELVLSKIAQALEVREGGSRPLVENVKSYLQDKCLLLLLDNFEQVISAAPLVSELLSAAPDLKVVVTSRRILSLRGEHVYQVPPLETPDTAGALTVEDLKDTESVLLFLDRGRAVRPGFSLTEENAGAVVEICRRLDGLPLAIELAAARLSILTPLAIQDRLEQRLSLLTGGPQDLPARQQTLRNTIDWSYELLEERDQALFTSLGVFAGGCDLEAAEAICFPNGAPALLDRLSNLLNSSMLRQAEAPDGRSRFYMLEAIREYALERLADWPDAQALHRRHAHYYANKLVNEMGFKIYSVEATEWLNWIDVERDNIEATLSWTQNTPEGRELGSQLVAFLTWFWYRRGYFHEGRRWAERVLSSTSGEEGDLERAMVLQGCSLLAMWQADLHTAKARADECLGLWQRRKDDRFLGIALMNSGIVLINMGKDAAAHPILEEARDLFQAIDDPYFFAIVLVHLGNVSLGLGRVQEARLWLEQALSLSQQIGEEWMISFALNNLGEVARVEGYFEQAKLYYQQSETLLRNMGDKGDLARIIHNRGVLDLRAGELASAEARFRESLSMFQRLGSQRGIAECLAGLAGLYAAREQFVLGAKLLGAAQSLMEGVGAAWWPADRIMIERHMSTIRAALDEDDFQVAWDAGETLPLGQTINLASS